MNLKKCKGRKHINFENRDEQANTVHDIVYPTVMGG